MKGRWSRKSFPLAHFQDKSDSDIVANNFMASVADGNTIKRVLQEACERVGAQQELARWLNSSFGNLLQVKRVKERGSAKVENDVLTSTGPWMLNDLLYRRKLFDKSNILRVRFGRFGSSSRSSPFRQTTRFPKQRPTNTSCTALSTRCSVHRNSQESSTYRPFCVIGPHRHPPSPRPQPMPLHWILFPLVG